MTFDQERIKNSWSETIIKALYNIQQSEIIIS